MKTQLLISLSAALLLSGCGDSPKSTGGSATTTTSGTATESKDYLSTIARGEQKAEKVVDTAAVDKAIQLFNVDKGRNPKDLNELVTEKYLPKLPTPPFGFKLSYDADSGTVKVLKQ